MNGGRSPVASAKVCPNCGAKNKKPIYKRVWVWILAVLLLVVIIGMVRGGSEDSGSSQEKNGSASNSKQAEASVDYETVNLSEMFDLLDTNALNARNTYMDKNVAFTGVVRNIDSEGSYISIERENADPLDFDTIRAKTGKKQEVIDQIATINTGDVVLVKGKITDVGEVMGYTLSIDSLEKTGATEAVPNADAGGVQAEEAAPATETPQPVEPVTSEAPPAEQTAEAAPAEPVAEAAAVAVAPAPVPETRTEYTQGEAASVKGVEYSITGVTRSAGANFDTPKEGYEYIIVNLHIANNSQDKVSYSGYNFKMRNSQGQENDREYVTLVDTDTSLGTGDLIPGGFVDGTLVYEEPVGDAGLKLVYYGNMFDDKEKFTMALTS